ncbi:NUDIX hydrolase [Chthonobacter rhizosphaerae]|uniref:NUDIX hydrolase n=1 Tax=Chthonobacter rhizosphaerae TaxID=2735553 RepID=UPI0015EF9E15|nr:NUDIX hydrolase [Chthonobacter rhizosphaerae]
MITPITDVNVVMVPGSWTIDAETRARIDAHWAEAIADNPKLWNGRVLGAVAPGLPGGLAIEGGVLTGTAQEGNFADYLAWRDWGFPEFGIRNLFGSALILSSDGALIYGVMGRHTANAGRIYPPGGNLEPRDITPDGRVHVIGSIEMELTEETGLTAEEADVASTLVAFDGPRISVGRIFRFRDSAADLVARIEAHSAAEVDPELDGLVVVRSASDLTERTPGYAHLHARAVLGR